MLPMFNVVSYTLQQAKDYCIFDDYHFVYHSVAYVNPGTKGGSTRSQCNSGIILHAHLWLLSVICIYAHCLPLQLLVFDSDILY